jgi:AraC-like DNA-binding protein
MLVADLTSRSATMLNGESMARVDDARSRPYVERSETFLRRARARRGLRSVEQRIVRGVVDYVEENYASSISLRDVAHALGYSPAHLTHRFSSLTGTPVTAWIIKRRLCAAQELLAGTKQDVITVCEAVGFADLCYFTRQFVRHVGLTPAQFRSANSSIQKSERMCSTNQMTWT